VVSVAPGTLRETLRERDLALVPTGLPSGQGGPRVVPNRRVGVVWYEPVAMAIPDYQTLMRPVLAAHTNEELSQAELRDRLADEFGLSLDEREELLPSGSARRFASRVGWATTYLVRAGLLQRPSRGVTRLTDRGATVLADHLERVDITVLRNFEEFRAFRSRAQEDVTASGVRDPRADEATPSSTTPQEAMEEAHRELRAELAEELLSRILDRDDRFFEDVVLDVLVGLGYGGSRREAAIRVGRSGDGGIDGVIQEDRLGLDVVYVQAKRWDTSRKVGPREIREFMGALQDHEAHKGVFITTSAFSAEATELARRRRISLLDGERLTRLMIDTGVGVSRLRSYEINRIDEDYFSEDDGGSGG